MDKKSVKEFIAENKKVFVVIGITTGVVVTAVAVKFGLAHKAAKLALSSEGQEIIAAVSEEII